MILFQFFSLAIQSLLKENSSEFRFSTLLAPHAQSIQFSFLVPSVTFPVMFSVPTLAGRHWSLSWGANCSGSAPRLLKDVHFNVFLFLNLSILLARAHLQIAGLSLVFILLVIHPSGN
jgi:hypothetical protein